jgi:hypothetical protein
VKHRPPAERMKTRHSSMESDGNSSLNSVGKFPDPTFHSYPDPDPTFSICCGSGSCHSLFSKFGPFRAPKIPYKASTFSLSCGSGFSLWPGFGSRFPP